MELKRVVVSGMGALTPIGNNREEFWNNLCAGTSGAAPITLMDASPFKTHFACEIKNFDPLDYIDRKEARKMDRYAQIAMITATEAMEDSNIELENMDLDRFGVIWGTGMGGIETFQEQLINAPMRDGVPRFSPFFISKMIPDIAAGQISIKYGLRGPNYATVSACASSTSALIDAFNCLRLGQADLILSGGSEAPVNLTALGGFDSMKALSRRNDDPTTASRPYDSERDGFVMGEGGAALLLEEYEHAKNRGAKIYAEIVGAGMSADAHHITATHPEGDGAYLSMRNALRDAGISPGDVDYINPHATSTPVGDIPEVMAVKRLLGDNFSRTAVSATKSMTGHLLGGAGAAEAFACIMATHDDKVPPTINTTSVDEQVPEGLNLVLGEAKSQTVNYALSNTFGFGGHNATLVVKKYSV